jgi:hypothetical protein
MAAEYDLTTEGGLREYLISRGDTPESITLLTGGTANYVYRVSYSDDTRTVIFKHAAQYLSSNKDFAFDSTRIDIEAAILGAMPNYKHKSPSNAHAVRVLNYSTEHKLLGIEDGGQRNLKEAYPDPALDIQAIAVDLARWLENLHGTTRTTHIKVPSQNLTIGGGDNNPIAVKIYRYSYYNLHLALAKFGHDTSPAERVNQEFGSLLEVEDECLCHGDFWPGNVLVRSGSGSDTKKHLPDLTIVDWEMSRRGTSATDVGQFAAEAFLLDRFRGGRGLRVGFLDEYIAARNADWTSEQLGKEWIRRMAVHWAVHVAFWPTRVPWTNEQGTKELVGIGIEVLQMALVFDWAGLKKSALFKDLSKDWEIVLINA